MSRLTNSTGFASKILYNSKMPAFTIYGSRGSTNTDRVRLTLAEGGFTDYELVLLNLQKGEQKVRDPRFLEDDAVSWREQIVYRIEPQTSSHSSSTCPPACSQSLILLGTNAGAPSPKNTSNAIRGVKYP